MYILLQKVHKEYIYSEEVYIIIRQALEYKILEKLNNKIVGNSVHRAIEETGVYLIFQILFI